MKKLQHYEKQKYTDELMLKILYQRERVTIQEMTDLLRPIDNALSGGTYIKKTLEYWLRVNKVEKEGEAYAIKK